MAIRGRKPKPTHLKLVTGNPGKRPLPEGAPEIGGDLAKPKYLKGKAARIWDDVVGTCVWFGPADVYAIGMFCSLQAEYERGPTKMIAARIAQLRAVRSELGLDPSSQSRLGAMKGRRKNPDGEGEKAKDPAQKYFGDH
jgi:phage terminase small subunit